MKSTRIDKGVNATLLLIYCFLAISLFGGWTYTYDTATPSNDDDPREAALRMREIKLANRERMDVDHVWDLTGTEVSDADTGEHRQITFHESIADPTQVADHAHLYMKSDELYYQDDTTTTIKLTDSGYLCFASLDPIANDTYLTAVDEAGTGTVDLIKAGRNEADDADVAVLPDAARLATDAAPVEDTDIVNMKYVDDQIEAIGIYETAPTVHEVTIAADNTWQSLDLTDVTSRSLVVLLVTYNNSNMGGYFRPKSDTRFIADNVGGTWPRGASSWYVQENNDMSSISMLTTDSSGNVDIISATIAKKVNVIVLAHFPIGTEN